jgi:hypothetical protein
VAISLGAQAFMEFVDFIWVVKIDGVNLESG